jgi:hypothetical protein
LLRPGEIHRVVDELSMILPVGDPKPRARLLHSSLKVLWKKQNFKIYGDAYVRKTCS